MNLMKCNNGHFYDGDKYASCPHCSGGAAQASGFEADSPTVAGAGVGAMNGFSSGPEDFATVPGAGVGGSAFSYVNNGFPTGPTVPGSMPNANGGGYDNEPVAKPDMPDDLATQGAKTSLVVGWLVVKTGEQRGRSKTLVAGKNFIGRDSSMDIVLDGDKSISRIKHAIVLYEPNMKKFIALPGESHELFYVNGEVVLNNVELKAYDVITIGKTELIFMPFCGEYFVWDEE